MITKIPEHPELATFHHVFGLRQRLPSKITEVVKSYMTPNEMQIIQKYAAFIDPLPIYVNLSDPEVLKTYLAPNFQNDIAFKIAKLLVDSINKSVIRPIEKSDNFGYAFGLNSESDSLLLKEVKDKDILEIAGAGGEHAILAAYAGANRVYMNDITPNEMARFQNNLRYVPEDVRNKLEGIDGDCFNILKEKPELAGKIDVIICRNLIHFFNDRKLAEFAQLLKAILKPGGKVFLTANSEYTPRFINPSTQQVFEENPDCTSFRETQCLLVDRALSNTPKDRLFYELLPCQGDMISTNFKNTYLYEREKEKSWVTNPTWRKTLSADVQKKLDPALLQARKDSSFQAIQEGSIRFLENHIRFYTETNLADTLKSYGFEVETTFVTHRVTGHIVRGDDRYAHGHQVGAVIRLPAPEATEAATQ
jgi:SAM-dependent methyltransferase